KEGLKIAAIGVMGTALNQLLYLGGLQHTEASHAAVLVTMIPVFAFLIALLTGREAFSPPRSLGVLLALGGALSLTGIKPLLEGTSAALGDALLVANCAAYAFYLVYSKPYVKRYGTIKVLALAFGASVFVAAPFGAPGVSTALLLDAKGALLLAYILIAPTALAYLLNAWALRRADASTVAIYIYLQPIAGVLLAANVLGDALDVRMIASAALIFTGIALVTRRKPTAAEPSEKRAERPVVKRAE
ncbi:MAG: DMT family transporter, partial [Myxococcota bacterium]